MVKATLYALLFTTACASAGTQAFRSVDVGTFKSEKDAGTFEAVLDVRTPEEFAAGHVPNARNMPVDQIKARLPELQALKTADVAVICEVGGRSKAAATALSEAGFTGIVDVQGGTRAWKAAGNAIEK